MLDMRLLALALVAALALAGCSDAEHEVDEGAWRTDLAAAGVTPVDWDEYRAATEDMCESDRLDLQVAANRDARITDRAMLVDFEHACPGRVDELEDAMAEVDGASGSVGRACELAPADRSESQARLAEAMGC